MLNTFIPILLVIGFVVANAIMMIALSHFLSNFRPTAVKRSPYESGMPVLGTARERFSIKFYLVAMLFIVFDIEVVFMIPWAAAFQQMTEIRGLLFVEMFVFVAILAAGFVYVWKRGALEWE